MARSPKFRDVAFRRDPDLPGVEIRFSAYRQEAFRPHTHRSYSVALVDAGRTRFVLGGATHRVTAGQVAVIPPFEVHACNPVPGSELVYRMFYVAPDWFSEAVGVPFPRFVSPVLDDPALFRCWERVYEAVARGGERLQKESRLLEAVAELAVRHGTERPPPGTAPPARLETARAYLEAHPGEGVSLSELSARAGLSRYHLLRSFREAFGLSPHAYQLQLRIELAKRLLRGDMPLGQVAVAAGFADQSHFTRHFRRLTGATPRQYRAAADLPEPRNIVP